LSVGSTTSEFLEQDCLALHHRFGRERPDGAEPQHRRAVGDNAHEVRAGGQARRLARVGDDGKRCGGNPGRIGQRQIALGPERLRRHHGDLSRHRLPVILERDRAHVFGHRPFLPAPAGIIS
jgi:hypothetical protein